MPALTRLVLALCLASAGWGAVSAWERATLAEPPPGFRVTRPSVPHKLARLAGPALRPGEGFPLDYYGTLAPDPPVSGRIEVRATLPVDGVLSLRASAGSPQLVLSRVGVPRVTVSGDDGRVFDCARWLPAPGPGPVDAWIAPAEGGPEVGVNGVTVHCTSGSRPDGAGAPIPAPVSGAQVTSGLRRVAIHAVTVANGPAFVGRPPRWGLRLAAALAGALLAQLLARLPIVWALPLLGCAPLAQIDLAPRLDAARIVTSTPAAWSEGLPVALSGLLAAFIALDRWLRKPDVARRWVAASGLLAGVIAGVTAGLGWWVALLGAIAALGLCAILARLGPVPGRAVTGAALAASATTLAASALQPHWPLATALAGAVAVPIVVVQWANLHASRVRGFNWVSLGGVGLALVLAEGALTWTATGSAWVGRPSGETIPSSISWARTWTAHLTPAQVDGAVRMLEGAVDAIPVPARNAPLRLAAFGGSTTAGAFEEVDQRTLWPARLQARLRAEGVDAQVLNLARKGWTSLQIRTLIERRMDEIDPDIALLYVGYNDTLTSGLASWTATLEAERHGVWIRRVSNVLSRVRLYQGLRFAIQGITGPPVWHGDQLMLSRANLEAILDRFHRRGTRVLLSREGVRPDPGALSQFGRLLAGLAEDRPDVVYVDGAAALDRPGRLFRDDCHLTPEGHELLARTFAETLQRVGWLPATEPKE